MGGGGGGGRDSGKGKGTGRVTRRWGRGGGQRHNKETTETADRS